MRDDRRHERTIPALADYWDGLVRGHETATPVADPALAAEVRRLYARDDAPGADPVFKSRLLARLEEQRATTYALLTTPLAPLAPLPPVRGTGIPLNGGRSPASSTPLRRVAWARGFGAQATMALLIALMVLAGFAAVGGGRLWRNQAADRVPAVPAFDPVPDAETRQGLLTQMTATGLPHYADWVGVDRWTYPPHSAPVTSAPLTGPTLMYVITGQVTVALDGQGARFRGVNHDGPGSMLSTTTGRVAAGEALLIPPHTSMTTWNDGPVRAKALVAIIMSNTISDWQLPYDQTAIEQEVLATTKGEMPAETARIALSRETLAPGERMPPPEAGTFRLVAAESKYLAYLGRDPDGAVTNLEKEQVGVLIVTVTAVSPAPASSG